MIKSRLIFFFCLTFFSVVSMCMGVETPESISERINSHLIIGDHLSACNEAYAALQKYPNSKELWKSYIRCLAKSGDEKGMTTAWKIYAQIYPEDQCDKEILEWMAWAVIEKGYTSASPLIRTIAILGAYFSQDAKGVAILLQGLSDDNTFIRKAAVKLSSDFHDASLQDKLINKLGNEKSWGVRLEVINSLGKLKVASSKKALEKIISSDHFHAEEKVAAIKAIVLMTETIHDDHLKKLSESNLAGFRMLACEFIDYFNKQESVALLFPMLQDHHANVRTKAMQTLGRFSISSTLPLLNDESLAFLALKGTLDKDPHVAIVSAYVLTMHSPVDGMKAFENLLKHPLRDVRLLAAASLAATGKYGLPLMKKTFEETIDPYVKMNLGIGLIGQREDIKSACDALYACLKMKEKWAFVEEDGVKFLGPSKIKHDDAIPNQPETVNLLTRLEVLQILSVVHYPHAMIAIKNFLKESSSGITGVASALLLTEGDDEAVEIVRKLLKDSDKKVSIQAALILSLWGDGDEATDVLQRAYDKSDRELKSQILEGIGRAKSSSSLLFLAEKLQEPFQTLRIIAAAALLECLYH